MKATPPKNSLAGNPHESTVGIVQVLSSTFFSGAK